MENRREIGRVEYLANAVIVVCKTGDKYFVKTQDVSPLGMGIIAGDDVPDIVGRDIIIVAKTLIMYADVTRQVRQDDGTSLIGIAARDFSQDVLEYLFDRI